MALMNYFLFSADSARTTESEQESIKAAVNEAIK